MTHYFLPDSSFYFSWYCFHLLHSYLHLLPNIHFGVPFGISFSCFLYYQFQKQNDFLGYLTHYFLPTSSFSFSWYCFHLLHSYLHLPPNIHFGAPFGISFSCFLYYQFQKQNDFLGYLTHYFLPDSSFYFSWYCFHLLHSYLHLLPNIHFGVPFGISFSCFLYYQFQKQNDFLEYLTHYFLPTSYISFSWYCLHLLHSYLNLLPNIHFGIHPVLLIAHQLYSFYFSSPFSKN